MCVFVDGREGVCMHAHICVGICVDNIKFEFAFKSMRLFRLQTVWVNLSQLKTLVVWVSWAHSVLGSALFITWPLQPNCWAKSQSHTNSFHPWAKLCWASSCTNCQSLCDLNSASISFSKSLLSLASHKLCQSLCNHNSALSVPL